MTGSPPTSTPPRSDLRSDRVETRRRALDTLAAIGPAAQGMLGTVFELAGKTKDDTVRHAAEAAMKRLFAPACYPRAAVEPIQKQAECQPTRSESATVDPGGRFSWTLHLAGNGAGFLVIERD